MYLWEITLVIQYPQNPMRFSCNEIKTGLVVAKRLLLPLDLLPHVLLLHTERKSSVNESFCHGSLLKLKKVLQLICGPIKHILMIGFRLKH